MIFRLNQLVIKEIDVAITFQHQKIVDVTLQQDKVYVLTSKDYRVYDSSISEMDESSKRILSSCRKGEWFLRFYLESQ